MSKLSLQEAKIKELESEIEARLAETDYSTKGCFGTLLRMNPDSVCKSCPDETACEALMQDQKESMVLKAEEEIEKIILDYELDAEINAKTKSKAKKATPKAKKKPASNLAEATQNLLDKIKGANGKPIVEKLEKPAEKPAEAPAPEGAPEGSRIELDANGNKIDRTGHQAPSSMTVVAVQGLTAAKVGAATRGIDFDKLQGRARIPFDWNGIAAKILIEKITDWKAINKLCVDHVPDKVWHASCGYRNAKKLMAELEKLGLARWNGTTKQVEYL